MMSWNEKNKQRYFAKIFKGKVTFNHEQKRTYWTAILCCNVHGKVKFCKKKSKWYLSPKLIFYFSFQSKSSPLYWSVKWYPYIWIRRCHPFIFYPSSNTVLFYSQSTVQNIPTNNCWNFKFKFYIVKWQKAEFLSLKMIFLLACEFSSCLPRDFYFLEILFWKKSTTGTGSPANRAWKYKANICEYRRLHPLYRACYSKRMRRVHLRKK